MKPHALTVLFAVLPAAALLIPVLAQDVVPGVHIPANRRHQGVSKFDLFPFTDRRKGDPDRYRAVNPNYVRKEGGRYYYLLAARPGTRYFDDSLTDKGVLAETNDLPVELSDTKEAKTADGKTVRYVFVKDKGYVPRNALTPAAEVRSGRWFRFPLKSGAHLLHDGTGIVRGTVAARAVRLNYGQQKQINGERCYYAFSTSIAMDGTTEKRGASGWIKASALTEGSDPQYSAEVVAKMQPPPAADASLFTAYEVTGGDPQEKTGSDASGKPIYRFGYADEKGGFAAYKVLPGVTRAESVAATDYLKRSDGVVNLGFNVAGVSNDTYRVGGAKRPLVFHRSGDRDATAVIDLFYPKDAAAPDASKPAAKMTFVYGCVDESGGKRWGWIPLGALKPATSGSAAK